MRPAPIILFERLYLAALAISVVAAVLNWSADLAAISDYPMIAGIKGGGRILPTVYPIVRGLVWAGWLLLWYQVARRGSQIARILVVIFALFAAYDGAGVLLAALAGPHAGWPVTAAIAEAALLVFAAANLLRPSARPWFAIRNAVEGSVA